MLDQFLTELRNIDVEMPLLGALVAGAIIGWERETQGKAAGLRTHTLVCFASALLTLAGLRMAEWQADLPAGAQIVSDMSRMPHGIITGVGFLGAGVIFRDGFTVQGLTTAATLWLTAAIGVVFGTGLWGLAALATLIALAVLVALRLVQGLGAPPPDLSLELVMPEAEGGSFEALARALAEQGILLRPISFEADKRAGTRLIKAAVTLRGAPIALETLAAEIARAPQVLKVTLSGAD